MIGPIADGELDGVLPHELAILATAREKRSAYPWGAHVIRGREAGVSEAAIDVISSGALADSLPARYAVTSVNPIAIQIPRNAIVPIRPVVASVSRN